MKNYAGKVFSDRYTLTRQIAVGAMGEVWAARDYLTYREIAIKVLRPELAGQKTFLQRLRVEARNAMQIEHPNLAGVLDHGEADGVGWIVMELVDGQPLNNYLAGGQRLTPQQLLPLLIQVAYALQAVNSHNVVHRDIKPSNIMITSEGIAKLTDFGISTTPDQETMTDAGMVMGTAQYLPPEQARGQEATHAGDLYALGVIAYEAAAGYRPFTGETQVDVAFAHVNEPVPELPDDVPDPLANIIYRLLRKNPAQRPADALELVRQLTAAASALQVSTNPQPLQLPAADTTATTPTASQPVVSEPAQTQEPARANESGEQDHPSSEESARASGQRDSVGIPHPRKSVQTAASRKSAVAPTRTSAPATSRKSAPANTRTAVPPKSTRTPAAASTGKSVPATSHNRARTDVPPTSTRAGLPRRLGNIAARRPAAASARTAVPTTSRKSAPASTRTAVPPKSTRTTTPWKHGQAPTPADSFDWSALLLLLLVAFTVFVIAILAFMRPSAPAVSPQENAASTQTTVSSSYLSLQTYKDPNYLTLGTSFDNPHLPGRLMLTDDTEVQHHG